MDAHLRCLIPVQEVQVHGFWSNCKRKLRRALSGARLLCSSFCLPYMFDYVGEANGLPQAPNATQGFAETFGCGLCQGKYAAQLTSAWEVSRVLLVS